MFTTFRLLHKAILFGGRRRSDSTRPIRRPRLVLEELETRTVPSASSLASPLSVATPLASSHLVSAPYAPAEIAGAYGVPSSVSNPNNTTIAIVDAYNDPNIASNLAAFDTEWGVSAPPSFKQVNETGGTNLPAGNADWGLEISLDVEWAHAIDPTANVLLVEASSASTSDLLKAVGYAASHANVVSMSWGASEFSGETVYDTGSGGVTGFNGFDSYTNVAFVASAGDTGGEVEWPSVSPYVLSVGGTTLSIASSGATYSIKSESAWSDGGGGVSSYEGKPTYQDGAQSDNARTTPDVSYDANPNSGVYVYDTYGGSGWYEVGGTSAGAPQWSAIVAQADQLRGSNNALNTATVEATLYSNPQDLNDVTSGSNGHAATAGYDLATGLGTPKAASVITALTNAALLSNDISQGSAPSNSGSVGGRGGRSGGREDATIALLIESEATAVVAVPSFNGTTSANTHAVVAAGIPASLSPAVASPLANSSLQSGGGGDDATLGNAPQPSDAPAPGVVTTEATDNVPWLGNLFTEAVHRLQLPFTAPPRVSPAAPTGHDSPPAPMKGPAAPMPSGKVGAAIPLEKIGFYVVPAAVGLCGTGLEGEERRRRERLLEKNR